MGVYAGGGVNRFWVAVLLFCWRVGFLPARKALRQKRRAGRLGHAGGPHDDVAVLGLPGVLLLAGAPDEDPALQALEERAHVGDDLAALSGRGGGERFGGRVGTG